MDAIYPANLLATGPWEGTAIIFTTEGCKKFLNAINVFYSTYFFLILFQNEVYSQLRIQVFVLRVRSFITLRLVGKLNLKLIAMIELDM